MRTVRDERGETLLELLVAVTIMGIALVAVVGGLVIGIHVSDIHRKQATAGAAAHDYAETVENWVGTGHFPACGAGSPSASLPAGYTSSISCADPASGLQKVTVTVASADTRATEHVTFLARQRCGPGDASC